MPSAYSGSVTPEEPGREPAWEPDVLPGYWQQTLPLGPDPDGEGELVATLVRRGDAAESEQAVLALHGYTDYFFNTELADHFAERGFTFYALDLHKCGRSRREGQTPHFTTSLQRYDAELNRAIDRIRASQRRTRLAEQAGAEWEVAADIARTANEAIHGTDKARLIQQAIGGLPVEQRHAIELAYFSGLTQDEISQKLNEPLGTIKARIRRGLLKLRDQLEGLL